MGIGAHALHAIILATLRTVRWKRLKNVSHHGITPMSKQAFSWGILWRGYLDYIARRASLLGMMLGPAFGISQCGRKAPVDTSVSL
jgi:hypothetical protein